MAFTANSLFSSDTRSLVLCIDDDSNILEITKWTLEKHGYAVVTTQEWHHGLDIVKQTPIDLVILDYEMPGIRGHEIALWIRLAKPDVPIILHSSAYAIPSDAKKFMDACIPKEADSTMLLAVIANLIDQRKGRLDQRQSA